MHGSLHRLAGICCDMVSLNAFVGGGIFGIYSAAAALTRMLLKSVGFHTHPAACSWALSGPGRPNSCVVMCGRCAADKAAKADF